MHPFASLHIMIIAALLVSIVSVFFMLIKKGIFRHLEVFFFFFPFIYFLLIEGELHQSGYPRISMIFVFVREQSDQLVFFLRNDNKSQILLLI